MEINELNVVFSFIYIIAKKCITIFVFRFGGIRIYSQIL